MEVRVMDGRQKQKLRLEPKSQETQILNPGTKHKLGLCKGSKESAPVFEYLMH